MRVLAAILVTALLGVGPTPAEARRRKPRPAVQQGEGEGEGTMRVKVHLPDPEGDETPGAPDRAPVQGYNGVSLQGGEPPEMKPPPAGLQAVTWPGFRADKSGSEVFLQLTGQVSYKQKVKGSHVLITLDKTVVPLRNNLRAVNTRNFRSPVAGFRLRRASKQSVQLDITLRHKAAPAVSLTQRGKYSFLVVAFPPLVPQ